MHSSVSTQAGVAVIRLEGRFDFNAHREFRDATETAIKTDGLREIEVDLAGVDYLDSSALGMLLMLRDRARNTNLTVSLVNCKGSVRQVLDIANFGKLFPIK